LRDFVYDTHTLRYTTIFHLTVIVVNSELHWGSGPFELRPGDSCGHPRGT